MFVLLPVRVSTRLNSGAPPGMSPPHVQYLPLRGLQFTDGEAMYSRDNWYTSVFLAGASYSPRIPLNNRVPLSHAIEFRAFYERESRLQDTRDST